MPYHYTNGTCLPGVFVGVVSPNIRQVAPPPAMGIYVYSDCHFRPDSKQKRVIEELQAFARTFQLSPSAFPWIENLSADADENGILVKCYTRVVSRDGHFEPRAPVVEVSFTRMTSYEESGSELTKNYWREFMRQFLTSVIVHELAESIYEDGVRVHDPHRSPVTKEIL
jgi:hypothetical protein